MVCPMDGKNDKGLGHRTNFLVGVFVSLSARGEVLESCIDLLLKRSERRK